MRKASAATCLITVHASHFSHAVADEIAKWVLRRETAKTVVIDLSQASDASTAAFARLVLLRRHLLRRGRDVMVCGLRDRAQWVYVISRLTTVLPQQQADQDCLAAAA